MRQIAKERGGKCLSEKYQDAHEKLMWECKEGHQWEAKPNNIKNGSWCKICRREEAANKLKLGIEEMRMIAEERGGKCLSDSYINANSPLLWECKHGHRWEARGNHIKRGGWCGDCSSGLGERICREFFEQIFKQRFPRSYPTWLITEEGNRMELDGYCSKLRIAFEHQGIQHYAINNLFMKTKAELERRKSLDRLKRELCKTKGVLLIQIPEVPTKVKVDNIRRIIKRKCEIIKYDVPENILDLKVDLIKAYSLPELATRIIEMHSIAKERGGKCLSEHFLNMNTKLRWECSKGHQWGATPHNVIKGSWCKKCANQQKAANRRLTIEQMKEIAIERGGKCLSQKYINSKTKLKWECSEGHQWRATPDSIKYRGSWCPICD